MKKIPAFLTFLAIAAICHARTITVKPDGTGDQPTIQAAIVDANDGDTVIVGPGRYYENIRFGGKAITVRSTYPNDPSVTENTIIDANGVGSVVTFANGEGRDSLLQGFTITNGSSKYGGGICCLHSSPVIANCIITNCYASRNGGGISCRGTSDAQIIDCTISYNSSDDGGGVMASGASVINSTIVHNSAGDRGGGIHFPKLLKNNLVHSNSAKSGGGIYAGQIIEGNVIYNNSASGSLNMPYGGGGIYLTGGQTVRNNTFVANSAPEGGNLYLRWIGWADDTIISNNIIVDAETGGGICYGTTLYTNVLIQYNDVWNNAGGNYVGLTNQTGLNGNISVDSVFINPDINDFHLQEDSPCINTGDPDYIPEPDETDLDGLPRINDGRIDMGAYEYNPPVEVDMTLTPQSLNCKSKGKWIKAHVTLPEELTAEDIDVNTPAVLEPAGIESTYIDLLGSNNGPVYLEIVFDRENLCDSLYENGLVEIELWGRLVTGRYFYATDTIKVSNCE